MATDIDLWEQKPRPPTPENLCAVEHPPRKNRIFWHHAHYLQDNDKSPPTHLLREIIADVRGDQDISGNNPT